MPLPLLKGRGGEPVAYFSLKMYVYYGIYILYTWILPFSRDKKERSFFCVRAKLASAFSMDRYYYYYWQIYVYIVCVCVDDCVIKGGEGCVGEL